MAELTRALGPWRGAAMMLNIVLGAGLLTLPGLAAIEVGAAAPMLWLACAALALPLLWVFAILGRRHADAGGLAAVMDRAFGAWGRIPATFLFLGAVALGLPAIALTGGHYVAAILGGPAALHAAWLMVLAVGVNFLSAEVAARVNAAIASALVAMILVIAALGWAAVTPGPEVVQAALVWPGQAVFLGGMMMVFFAFTGWEVSANLTGEFRDPARDVPRAMAVSFVVAVALYGVLALVVAGAGPVGADPAPFARIFDLHFGATGRIGVAAVSVLLIFANLSSAVWAVSRMVWSAARDGLLPQALVPLRNGVPVRAVLAFAALGLGVVFASGAGWLDLGGLLEAAGQNFLLLYAGAATALLRLAEKPWHRWLSGFCLFVVAAFLFARGGDGAAYPAGLLLAGSMIALVTTRRGARGER